MRVTFLGTGSAMPTGERFQTGLLLESGDDRLLVDCGSGALHGLQRTDVGYEGIDAVLLTHHHLDHLSDLMPLCKARWLAGETELTITGPPGTRDLVSDLFDVHDYLQDRLDLTIREVEPGSFDLAGFDVDATETRHSMYCLAYRFAPEDADDGDEHGTDDASSDDAVSDDAVSDDAVSDDASSDDASSDETAPPTFAFSGDTEAFEELIEFADGAAVLAHDCSFPDEVDVSNHPTPSELGRVLGSADADVGRVYLTHLYPHTDGKHEEMLASVGEGYDGDVRFARDGLSIEID